MAEAGSSGQSGVGDLFALFGGNPLASISKNVEHFRSLMEGSVAALANMNRTMESLDAVAKRVTALLDDVEGPIRAWVPQMTKVSTQSAALYERMSEPLEKMLPGLGQLANTLSSPSFSDMESTLNDFLSTLGDFASRMRPLGQMAEAAGAMFGMRGLSGLRNAAQAPKAAPRQPDAPAAAATATATKTPAPKKAAAKKAGAKKSGAKKKPAKKATSKKKAPSADA